MGKPAVYGVTASGSNQTDGMAAGSMEMILGNGTRANALGAATAEPATNRSDKGDVVAGSFRAEANESGFRPSSSSDPTDRSRLFAAGRLPRNGGCGWPAARTRPQSRQVPTLRSKKDRTHPGTWRSPTYSRLSELYE